MNTLTERKSHPAIVVYLLLAVNVLAFAYTSFGAGDSLEYALIPDRVDEAPWTLLTTGFVHAGILHIGMNMLILVQVGQGIEKRFGSFGFAGIYFLSLAGSSAMIYLFTPALTPTVGASGAIFGLIGFLVFQASKEMLPSLVVFIALNVYVTFTVPNVSWQGHAGGFIAGLILGGLVKVVQLMKKHNTQNSNENDRKYLQ